MATVNNYIAIEGNIGAGKTTLSKLLAEEMNARLILEEFADNPFLAAFYENRERYAFSLEMSFLADRYHQLSALNTNDLFQPFTLADYSIYKSLIFAQNNLRDKEMSLYRNFFEITASSLRKPDLIIYLHRSMSKLQSHIRQRGRSYEQAIENSYLDDIQANYIRFFKQRSEIKVVVVNADNYDFLNSADDLAFMKSLLIKDFKPGLNFMD